MHEGMRAGGITCPARTGGTANGCGVAAIPRRPLHMAACRDDVDLIDYH